MTTPIDSDGTTASAVTSSPAEEKNKWSAQVAGFAKATGSPVETVNEKLKPLVGEPSDGAADMLADPTIITDSDLHTAFTGPGGIPIGVFRTHLHILRSQPKAVSKAQVTEGAVTPSLDVLPPIPDDVSFVASLKVGGELKVGTTEVLSAIKAGLASTLGLFDLTSQIRDRMEEFAEQQGEPVGKDYFELQKLVVSRSYADVLGALGVEGNFMSEKRKNAFLKKVDEHLWSGLHGFHLMLTQWQESWQSGFANPGFMMAMVAGSAGSGIVPPGMLSPPDTSGLHDQAEGVFEAINKIFAGLGIPVARALAYDATRIKNVLENESLPPAIGFINKDQMLKGLGVAIGSDFVRLERNLTRFALAIMEFKNVTSPNQEIGYLVAMFQLGSMIPWEKLVSNGVAGVRSIGGGNLRGKTL